MKFATHILEIIDVLYYPTKIFGMAPYIKSVNAQQERAYVRNTKLFKYFIHLTIILIIIVTSSLERTLLEIKLRQITFFDSIRGFIYIMSQLATFAKLFEFIQKQTSFLACLKLIEQSDNLLKDIGTTVSYKSIHILLLTVFITFPIYMFGMVAPIWEFHKTVQLHGFSSREALIYVAQFINLGVLYGIRFTSVYLYNIFAFIATQRLRSLNEYLKTVEENREDTINLMNDVIIFSSKMHNIITKLNHKINKTFGWSMFTTILLCFLEIIASIVMRGELTQSTKGLMFFITTVFTTTALGILLIGERIKFESSRTGPLLCDLTMPYTNQGLNKTRCSLLYQILEEPLVLTAGGFYVLNAKTVTSHIGLLSTVLMFFLKIRDLLHL